jgi:hypothetical protein
MLERGARNITMDKMDKATSPTIRKLEMGALNITRDQVDRASGQIRKCWKWGP